MVKRNHLIIYNLKFVSIFCYKNYFRRIMSITITITQFGIAVVYLILSADNLSSFAKFISEETYISPSIFMIILAAGLLPLTFLKSPQDFW